MKKIILVFILFLPVSLFADGAGVTNFSELKIVPGARQAAMSEAFTGLADDINAIYWNPAGLAFLNGTQLCFMRANWLMDGNFSYGAANFASDFGTIGVYASYFDLGSFNMTTEDPLGNYILTDQKVTETDMNVIIAHSAKITDDFSFGIKWILLFENVYNDSGSGSAFGISFFNKPTGENYSWGAALENLGLVTNRDALPMVVRLGGSYRFPLLNINKAFSYDSYVEAIPTDSVISADAVWYPVEQIFRANIGLESTVTLGKYKLSVRGGINDGNQSSYGYGFGWATGLGVAYDTGVTEFCLDYAYTPVGELGDTHRMSVTGKFGGQKEPLKYPDKAKESCKRGDSFMAKNDIPAALNEYHDSVKYDNTYCPAYLGMGKCFTYMGEKVLASEAYKKAHRCDQDNKEVNEYLQKITK